VRLDLKEASAKVRSGPPKDNEVLYDRVAAWAGHVPIKLAVGRPVADPNLRVDLPLPNGVASLAERFDAIDLGDVGFPMPDYAPVQASEDASPHEIYPVTIEGARAFAATNNATILSQALAAGVVLPFGCAAGGCGACKARLSAGCVEMRPYEKAALSDAERRDGFILTCCAEPRSACTIVLPTGGGAQTFDAEISGLQWLTHDIVGLTLQAKGRGPLAFTPGQFVMLQFGSLPEREYSMASQSCERDLQFHIRVAPDGNVSQYIAKAARVGDGVRVRGPFGVAVYEDQETPIVALAGGSGLAPIRAIVDRALTVHPGLSVRLYIGVRDERDLYLLGHFEALAGAHPRLSLHPVLSLPTGKSRRRMGLLADVLRRDGPNLAAARVYIAGPPAMVDSCRAAALSLGAREDAVFADAFLSSSDKPGAPASSIPEVKS